MAYTLGNWYYFEAFGGNSGLFLNREGSGALQNHQNISIYKNTTGTADNPDHQFKLEAAYHNGVIEGCSIRSMLNEAYGLNIYGYGSDMTAEANCNLAIVGGTTSDASNYNDTLIDLLTVDGDQMLYRIKLIKHPGLFLTATSNSNNADVRWMKESGGSNQLWKLRTSETGGSSGGGSIEGNPLTYPTEVMRITQPYNSGNHLEHSQADFVDYPIDEACEDTGRSYMYCPCDEMEVKRVYGLNGEGTNTIWLQSTSPVKMPYGTDYVTMMVLHPNDDTLSGIAVKRKFHRGDKMFLEGNDNGNGKPISDHFHIAVATGKYTGNGWVKNNTGTWVLQTTGKTIKPEQAFFVDTSFTRVVNTAGLSFTNL